MPYKNEEDKIDHRVRYRKEHPDKVHSSQRAWYWEHGGREKHQQQVQERKLMVLSHYSKDIPTCECCGEKNIEFLTVDHINGGGNQHRKEVAKRGKEMYRWIVDNNFPEMFRVLCLNCNFSLGHYGYCPHSQK